jgi:AraC family transcriptional regulator, arabinose operon regulatory protein
MIYSTEMNLPDGKLLEETHHGAVLAGIVRSSTFFTDPPDVDLCLEYTGKEKCAPGHCWQGTRNHFVLHYVLRGKGLVQTKAGRQRLEAGDGFLFFPGQPCWYRADEEDPWTYTWVGFAGRYADHLARQAGFSEEKTVWRAEADAPLRRYFRQLAGLAPSASPLPSPRATGILYLLLDRVGSFMKPVREAPNGILSSAVKRAFLFVEQHFDKGIGVSDIARCIGMERTYFSDLFKRAAGITPSRYLQAYRIARAERLLAESDLSVKEIAASVGYRDYFVFTKCFKKTHFCTPREYRAMKSVPPKDGPSTG